MERKSETKIIWVVVALIGAQLLGVDANVLISILGGVVPHAAEAADAAASVPSTGISAGNISLPVLAGLYAYLRSDLKKQREGGGQNANT